MELALAGIPGAADGSMTMRRLGQWYAYARKNGLPYRMLQAQIALIGLRIAQALGAEGMKLDDFMVELQQEPDHEMMDDDDLEAAEARALEVFLS